jgi:hypothetical protein
MLKALIVQLGFVWAFVVVPAISQTTQIVTPPPQAASIGDSAKASTPGLGSLLLPGYTIPATFKPSNFMQVFSKKKTHPKGEYETEEAYRSRLNALAGDEYVFKVSPTEIKYSPEEGQFTASFLSDAVYLGFILESRDSRRASFTVRSSDKKTGSYPGVTGLGVKVTVHKDTEENDALAYKGDSLVTIKLPIPAKVDTAPALKPNLEFLAICRLAPGVVGPARMTKIHLDPEYPYNLDRTIYYRYLYVDRISLVAIDRRSRSIVARADIVDAPNEKEKDDTAWDYPELEGKTSRWN